MGKIKKTICKALGHDWEYRSLGHDWEYHLTTYRCRVDEYSRICKRCGKSEDTKTVYYDEDGEVERIVFGE